MRPPPSATRAAGGRQTQLGPAAVASGKDLRGRTQGARVLLLNAVRASNLVHVVLVRRGRGGTRRFVTDILVRELLVIRIAAEDLGLARNGGWRLRASGGHDPGSERIDGHRRERSLGRRRNDDRRQPGSAGGGSFGGAAR